MSQGVIITTVGWIVLGVAAWLVVAAVVGVLIGRMIRQRDRQVPPGPEIPQPDGAADAPPDPDPPDPPRVADPGRPRRRH